MRLVIIHHDYTDLQNQESHFIYALIPHWEQRGIEVRHCLGTHKLPEGDAALLHVDLSVVPDRFLRAACHYPLALNFRISDIRKSSLPGRDHALISPFDFNGAVVVKTELNHGGIPENNFFQKRSFRLAPSEVWYLFRNSQLPNPLAYHVYDSAAKVSKKIWEDRRYMVEKFLPEREKGLYVLRYAYFFGKTKMGYRIIGDQSILRWSNRLFEEFCPIPPEVCAYRERMGLDYGKIDFVLHEGSPVILDVNKTIGGPASSLTDTPLAQALAAGLTFSPKVLA